MKFKALLCLSTMILLTACGAGKSGDDSQPQSGITPQGNDEVPTKNIISAEEAVRAAIPQEKFDELDAKLSALDVDTTSLTGTWLLYAIAKGYNETTSPTLKSSTHSRVLTTEVFTIIEHNGLDKDGENIDVDNCTNDQSPSYPNAFFSDTNNEIIIPKDDVFPEFYAHPWTALIGDQIIAGALKFNTSAITAKVFDNRRIDFLVNKKLQDVDGADKGNLEITIRARKIRDSVDKNLGLMKVDGQTGSGEDTLNCMSTKLQWAKMLTDFNGPTGTSVTENDSITDYIYLFGSFAWTDSQDTHLKSSEWLRNKNTIFTDRMFFNGEKMDSAYGSMSNGVNITFSDTVLGLDKETYNNTFTVQDTIAETYDDSNFPAINASFTGTKASDATSHTVELTIDPFTP